MEKVKFNEIIKSNEILLFFLSTEKTNKIKTIRVLILFLIIPIILLFLSNYKKTLFLDNDGYVGMLDDKLFLFTVFLVPSLILILNLIIKRFISFLEELPNFTKGISDINLNNLITKHLYFINKKRTSLIIVKSLLFIYFIFANTKALYTRKGAWNSPDFLLEFILTLILVAIILFVLTQILIKLVLIILAQIKLTTELSHNNFLDIKPLSLDKSGSLSSLSELSLSFTYILIPFMFLAITHYLTWGTFTIGFAAGIILLSLSTIFLFFFPLGTVHTLMKKSKKQFLKEIDDDYISFSDKLLKDIKSDKKDINETKEYCDTIKQIYEKAKDMPVWPFDIKIMLKFITVVLGPIVLVLLEIFLSKLFEYIF